MIALQLNNIPLKKNYKTLLDKWFELYCDDLYKRTFEVINDKEKSFRIIKDTFTTALLHLDIYKAVKNERAWLFGILDYNIKQNMVHNCSHKGVDLYVEKALSIMPKTQQNAFILKTYKGYKTKDICKTLDINEKQFWTYIHNTRNVIKKQIVIASVR